MVHMDSDMKTNEEERCAFLRSAEGKRQEWGEARVMGQGGQTSMIGLEPRCMKMGGLRHKLTTPVLSSCRFRPLRGFYRGFNNLWGPEHQSVSGDQSSVTIWLDRNSGSGFKSIRPFRNGYFGASIKLQPGYTAGVITAFYLSNNQAHPGFHDEVDIEFLGTTPGKPYTLQTNVYVRGSGDGNIIGREMKFHLWFDPTAGFHNYGILWNPNEIIFFVDDVPIRQYPRKSAGTFPRRPMWLYGSIWDASSWATEDGKYRADYRYQPFVARFTRFIVRGCAPSAPPRCRPAPSSSYGAGLSRRQYAAMGWAQRHFMVYDYCRDPKRDHSLTPECRS